MRRSLLNNLNLTKCLRQALVLFTLLLLPSAAWGQITVADVQLNNSRTVVTHDDINSIKKGTVTYDPYNNILTLEDADITYERSVIIVESSNKLTIDIKGDNTITTTSSYPVITRTGDASPEIEFTSSTNTGSLILEYAGGDSNQRLLELITPSGLAPKFLAPETANDWSSATKAEIKALGLTVAGVTATTGNCTDMLTGDNKGKVSFTPAEGSDPATLTLAGVNIGPSSAGIVWSGFYPLKIKYSGNNIINTRTESVKNEEDGYCIFYNGSNTGSPVLSLSASDDASTLVLKPSNGESNSRAAITRFSVNCNGWGMYYSEDYSEVDLNEGLTPGKEVIISKEPPLGLSVAGVPVTSENKINIFGDGTVAFAEANEAAGTPATLTLNGATISGNIQSSISPLTVHLIGSNTIQGNGSSLITSLNGGTLTFDSDGTTISLLEFKDASGNKFPNNPISGFAEVKYGWVEYVESEGSKKVCSWDIEILKNGTAYRIYDGNKDHILGEGDESVKYSHDATNGHVITLNNAEVNCIWTDIHADITIALNGTNRVIDTGRTYAIYSKNGKINFVKAEGATSVELTATSGAGGTAISTYSLGSGLYEKPMSETSTVITDDPEFIIIENYVMTDDRSIGTATSGITYNSTEKILTFNSYAGDLTSQIKTGVQGLTIKLKGTSTVAAGSLDYPFKAMTNTASILFDGENDSETGSLVMDTNSDSAPFEGFAEGAITYNKVVYSRDDGGNNIHTIKAPTAPAMSLDNEKVKLTKDYDDGTIYYSIAYADDTPSETGVKYSEPFAITHPGVVTAWVEANNATTGTVTGKHFAYQDAPYTMAINGIKTPTLLPTIAEGDVISLQRYASEDEDIASFIDGLITAKKPGTVTLSAILKPGDNTPFKVLNPVSDPNDPNKHTVSFIVYVGEPLSNYFEGSNEFASFYNETAEIYAVPQGMKAYVVTGASGNKLVTVETTVLPPNTVVLLEKGSAISFTKVPSEGAAPGGNLLKHATADISVTTESSLYVLYNDMYVKATAGIIPTGKNYLDLSLTINAGTRGFYTIGEDEATSLREVKSTLRQAQGPSDDAWYLLDGRKLSGQPTKKGIYIYKGKKVKI